MISFKKRWILIYVLNILKLGLQFFSKDLKLKFFLHYFTSPIHWHMSKVTISPWRRTCVRPSMKDPQRKKRKHLTSIWNPMMKHASSVVLVSEEKSFWLRYLNFMSGYLVRYVTCCAIENAYTFNIFCTCQKY